MLKRKISKAEWDVLTPQMQAFYKAEGADFLLQVEVSADDDPGALKRALERERADNTRLNTEVTDLRTKVANIPDKVKDIMTLEESYKAKLADKDRENKKEQDRLSTFVRESLVDSVALNLATDLSGENAHLLLPHVRTRLTADLAGERPSTRVLDKDGKVSASTVEDLKKEIAGDKRFAPLVIASRASGGGAAGGGRPGAGGAGSGAPQGKKFRELTDKERVEWFQRDPDGFKQAAQDANRPAYATA